MFRFIHTADLHLDSPLRGLSSRQGTPVEELRGASRKALDRLIDLAVSERVDLVVIAGDIYDQDWKDYNTGLFFRSRMAKLQAAGIPVYMISGNHDAASIISRKLTLPANVQSFSSRSAETFVLDSLPVAIHGMSFPNRAVEENLIPRYPAPIAGKFNIGLLHTSLAGAPGHDTYAPCSVEDLVAKGYDYWALGHVHQPAVVRKAPWVVFPGNIQGRHVKESGARGCFLVTVNDELEVADCTWTALDVARWKVLTVDLAGEDSFDKFGERVRRALGDALQDADDRLLAVRIILTGATPLHGMLASRTDRYEAEIEGYAQDFGEGRIWIEQIRLQTRPIVSLEELALHDALTRVVVESIAEAKADPGKLPDELEAALALLPQEMAQSMRESWTGTGWEKLAEDSCSMILERLTEKAGKS